MSPSQGEQSGPAADAPADADQRIAQTQLASRLEELFHGIQTTLFAQDMAAQQQLQSIADVWAATARYQLLGLGKGPGPIPDLPEGQVLPESDPAV